MGALSLQDKDTNQGGASAGDFGGIDLGRPETLRYNILSYVSKEEYDRSIKMLKDFIDKESEYPNFRLKVERYALHSIDLIFAIRTKRNFPGLSGMTLTKQQELKVKCKEHFSELSIVLQKIERCLEELRLDDAKSTKIVVKAVWLSLLTVFLAAAFLDLSHGMLGTAYNFINDQFDTIVFFVIQKIF